MFILFVIMILYIITLFLFDMDMIYQFDFVEFFNFKNKQKLLNIFMKI
jgi:hypothetical protein